MYGRGEYSFTDSDYDSFELPAGFGIDRSDAVFE